jgi:hypothetical protein
MFEKGNVTTERARVATTARTARRRRRVPPSRALLSHRPVVLPRSYSAISSPHSQTGSDGCSRHRRITFRLDPLSIKSRMGKDGPAFAGQSDLRALCLPSFPSFGTSVPGTSASLAYGSGHALMLLHSVCRRRGFPKFELDKPMVGHPLRLRVSYTCRLTFNGRTITETKPALT